MKSSQNEKKEFDLLRKKGNCFSLETYFYENITGSIVVKKSNKKTHYYWRRHS